MKPQQTQAILHLVSHHLCPYVQRSIITLTEKNIPHKRSYVDLSAKPDWFLEISPLGKVPLLKVDDTVLFESAVICEYLNEITPGSLHPEDALQKAIHRSWIEFGSTILDNIAGFYNANNQEIFNSKHEQLTARFAWLESHLQDGPYFAGEKFSLVDAVYGPVFRYFDVFEIIDDFKFFDHTPKIQAWRRMLHDRPSIKKAVSDDYPQQLLNFIERRNSYISQLINRHSDNSLSPMENIAH